MSFCLSTSSICILIQLLVEYRTILISTEFRCAGLIREEAIGREKRLFQCRYRKLWRFLDCSASLRPSAYYTVNKVSSTVPLVAIIIENIRIMQYIPKNVVPRQVRFYESTNI